MAKTIVSPSKHTIIEQHDPIPRKDNVIHLYLLKDNAQLPFTHVEARDKHGRVIFAWGDYGDARLEALSNAIQFIDNPDRRESFLEQLKAWGEAWKKLPQEERFLRLKNRSALS